MKQDVLHDKPQKKDMPLIFFNKNSYRCWPVTYVSLVTDAIAADEVDQTFLEQNPVLLAANLDGWKFGYT